MSKRPEASVQPDSAGRLERFVVRYDDLHWTLVDSLTGRELGSDGGEPEDQLLVRDWRWVPEELNRLARELAAAPAQPALVAMAEMIDVVFDGPPGPESGRFIEVENADGKSISIGEWITRPDGWCVLRLEVVAREGAGSV